MPADPAGQAQPEISGWVATAGDWPAPRPRLSGTQRTDWLVLGGGLGGLSATRRLQALRPGERILLLDAGRLGQGAASRNSGFVVAWDLPAPVTLSRADTREAWLRQTRLDSAGAAMLRAQVQAAGIACDWQEAGHWFTARDPARTSPADIERLARELLAAGFEARMQAPEALQQRLGSPHWRVGLWGGDGNATLQPGKLLAGLVRALPAGIEAYEQSPVLALERRALGDGWRARLPEGEVLARQVLVTLHAGTEALGLGAAGRILPLRLSASLTRPLREAEMPPDLAPWAMLALVPGGPTLRLMPDRRLLIRRVAGYAARPFSAAELAAAGQVDAAALRRRWPELGPDLIEHVWQGRTTMTRGGRHWLQRRDEGLWMMGGCNGSGLSRMTLLGALMAELAAGAPSDLARLALEMGRPGWIPPDPLRSLGARVRVALVRSGARAE